MGLTIYGLDATINFGKYKGRTVREVTELNVEYISWCLINIEDFLIGYEVEEYAKKLADNGALPIDLYALIKLDEKNILIDKGVFYSVAK